MASFSMVLAVDENNGIGRGNDLAWRLKEDLKYFSRLTTQNKDLSLMNAVIMGKNTWDSLPGKFKPLPNRVNCILSRTLEQESTNSKLNDFVLYFNDFNHCLKELESKPNVGDIFVIGGGEVYNSLLDHTDLDTIYLTQLEGDFDCDVFFDGIPKGFELKKETDLMEENGIQFSFQIWKKNKQEK